MQCPVKKAHAEVREVTKWVDEFQGHIEVKAAMEKYVAMLRENHTDIRLSCHNGTVKNPHTRWRRKETGAHPPDRCSELSPEPTPHLTGTPPLPGTPRLPGCHICLERLLCHPVTMTELNIPKASICLPDIRIHILHLPAVNSVHLMHVPRIAITIQILIQIC